MCKVELKWSDLQKAVAAAKGGGCKKVTFVRRTEFTETEGPKHINVEIELDS